MPEKEFPELAANLKALREARGLSQQQLAEKAGVSISVLFQIEQGRKKDPKLSTLVSLAEGLGISPAEFVAAVMRRRKGK